MRILPSFPKRSARSTITPRSYARMPTPTVAFTLCDARRRLAHEYSVDVIRFALIVWKSCRRPAITLNTPPGEHDGTRSQFDLRGPPTPKLLSPLDPYPPRIGAATCGYAH